MEMIVQYVTVCNIYNSLAAFYIYIYLVSVAQCNIGMTTDFFTFLLISKANLILKIALHCISSTDLFFTHLKKRKELVKILNDTI